MNTFTISIESLKGNLAQWIVRGELDQPGQLRQIAEETIDYEWIHQIPDALPEEREYLEHSELITSRGIPLQYGKTLGEHLFLGKIRELFEKVAYINSKQLHVILDLRDRRLEIVAWQRLCCPRPDGSWDHLRLIANLPFSIEVAPDQPLAVTQLDRRDLRALIVVASPPEGNRHGLDSFDAEATVAGLKMALGRIDCTVLANLPTADDLPTLEAFRRRLGEQSYSLIHFVCHGQILHESVLYLLDEQCKVAGYGAGEMIADLNRLHTGKSRLRCVFLSACDSANSQTGEAIGDLGRRLVREAGIPAVIAMTESISIPIATTLSERFYRHLAFHGFVDSAINAASAELADEDEITVPTLLSSLHGASLCLESSFSEKDLVWTTWNQWLKDHQPKQLIVTSHTVKSPLEKHWSDFINGGSFQYRISELIDKIDGQLGDDHTEEWRHAVNRLCQVDLDRTCDDIVATLDPLLSELQEIDQYKRKPQRRSNDHRKEFDPMFQLRTLVGSRRFRCCFPVFGQFGSGKSYFVKYVADQSRESSSNLLVLPIDSTSPDSLEEVIRKTAELASGGLRTWKNLEELNDDLAWHGATLTVVIDDLHEHLDLKDGRGWKLLELESTVKKTSREQFIRWLFTIQDTCFDKVNYRARFWQEYGLGASERYAGDGSQDLLLGWVSLNDRMVSDKTGLRILECNLKSADSSLPIKLQPVDANSTQQRHLSLPLVAAILADQYRRGETQKVVSVNREMLVNELLNVLFSTHGGSNLRSYVNQGLLSLSKLFFEQTGAATLALVDQTLSTLGGKAEDVFDKLTQFGLLGLTMASSTSTPDTTIVEYRFDPVWHFFLARSFLSAGPLLPQNTLSQMNDLLKRLVAIGDLNDREGVGEFCLVLLMAKLKDSVNNINDAAKLAAMFAITPELPGAAAFRAACFEPVEFQVKFSTVCRKKLAPELDPRILFCMVLFVDVAWETPITSGAALLADRYRAIGLAGYADYCRAVLCRRIRRCRNQEHLWAAFPNFSGCEALNIDHNGVPEELNSAVSRSSHAFVIARVSISQLKSGSTDAKAADALPNLISYLVKERGRAAQDYSRHKEIRSPYFFRQCLLFHYCDWYLRENDMDAWKSLNKADWYHEAAKKKFGDLIALEMEQEVNKAFGRWYRRNCRDIKNSEAYYRLLEELIDINVEANSITAHFMMRHTVMSQGKVHFVDRSFEPLHLRLEELARNPQNPKLKEVMSAYPVRIRRHDDAR